MKLIRKHVGEGVSCLPFLIWIRPQSHPFNTTTILGRASSQWLPVLFACHFTAGFGGRKHRRINPLTRNSCQWFVTSDSAAECYLAWVKLFGVTVWCFSVCVLRAARRLTIVAEERKWLYSKLLSPSVCVCVSKYTAMTFKKKIVPSVTRPRTCCSLRKAIKEGKPLDILFYVEDMVCCWATACSSHLLSFAPENGSDLW